MLSVNCEKAFQFYFFCFFHEVMKVEQKIVKKKIRKTLILIFLT
jgi:hypothetical protein